MLRVGDTTLFRVDTLASSEDYKEFFLTYLGSDETGMVMKGTLPFLWVSSGTHTYGPVIFDDDFQYEVIKVEYDYGLIWLAHLG